MDFSLEEYLSQGIENIVKGAVKATLRNPKQSLAITKFALHSKEAARIRSKKEKEGVHIPPFLIASITNSCNLYCKGCYSRANEKKVCCVEQEIMSNLEWNNIFADAAELGISFILIAGGEPMLRRKVIETAGKYKKIMFPIFSNGTLINDSYLSLFDQNRNLLPIISLEGEEAITDQRRGKGIYQKLMSVLDQMQDKGIFFGISITVTKDNLYQITDEVFLSFIEKKGCKLVFYVEYVPMINDAKMLAPGEQEREYLDKKLQLLRVKYEEMLFISFPGDEKTSGGCLAAGRGFFHINACGNAEPCPFSPYSDMNVRECSLLEALNSPLFLKLKSSDILLRDHTGGCVLFEQEEEVKKLNRNM